MTDESLKPYYRQSKYYSLDYNKETNQDFIKFADKLTKEIKNNQTLDIANNELKKHPSYLYLTVDEVRYMFDKMDVF